MITAGR